MADNMTPAQRSRTMSRIRSKDTQPELKLRRTLHGRGLRYRVDAGWLPGRPDVVFTKQQVAVFVDGDFWHGYNFEEWKDNLQPYWKRKIAGNRQRDQENTQELRQRGWTVVRVWEHEIKDDAEACADRVERLVRGQRGRQTRRQGAGAGFVHS